MSQKARGAQPEIEISERTKVAFERALESVKKAKPETKEKIKMPVSDSERPTAYEVGHKGVLAKWKYRDSSRYEDGASRILQGKDGNHYAYQRNYTFEVVPTELKNGMVPKYSMAFLPP